jgi:hypothetical protein
MNEQPLDEMIRHAVGRAREQEQGPIDEDRVVEQVLQDPDVALLMKGVRAHDRSEGLEEVYQRDIRRKVAAHLRDSESGSEV